MKIYIFCLFLALVCGGVLSAQDLNQLIKDNNAQDKKLTAALQKGRKKPQDTGIILPEHAQYMGKPLLITLNGATGFDDPENQVTNLVSARAAAEFLRERARLNGPKSEAILVDGDTLQKHYFTMENAYIKITRFDPDLSSQPNDIANLLYPLAAVVFKDGNIYMISRFLKTPQYDLGSQYRLYHYTLDKEPKTSRKVFTDVSGFDFSLELRDFVIQKFAGKFKAGFKQGDKMYTNTLYHFAFPTNSWTIEKAGFSRDSKEAEILWGYEHPLLLAADFMDGDTFRRNFIRDKRIKDIYPPTTKDKVKSLFTGDPADTRTDKITKNVILAKRISNTEFYTYSIISGKPYVHKFVLENGKEYSENMNYQDIKF
jgi:hypothetical protein